MKTSDFIKKHCAREACPDFDCHDRCRAYDGEECDAALLKYKRFLELRWKT